MLKELPCRRDCRGSRTASIGSGSVARQPRAMLYDVIRSSITLPGVPAHSPSPLRPADDGEPTNGAEAGSCTIYRRPILPPVSVTCALFGGESMGASIITP